MELEVLKNQMVGWVISEYEWLKKEKKKAGGPSRFISDRTYDGKDEENEVSWTNFWKSFDIKKERIWCSVSMLFLTFIWLDMLTVF